MKGYLFPGQGAQFTGMGKDLYDEFPEVRQLFEEANDALGFKITEVMFGTDVEALRRTDVTQPAIYLHSLAKVIILGEDFTPDMVAGHSLGEFSALAACGAFSYIDGLNLVATRASAMQKACEMNPGTMAAVIGLSDEVVDAVCNEIDEIVVPANYNCPGQLVISGTLTGVALASELLQNRGAQKIVPLAVGGAFHSPLMEPARQELKRKIESTAFNSPICNIYQNTDASPTFDVDLIRLKLIEQLTASVRWTQTMENMIGSGMSSAIEVGGSGSVLRGLLRRIDRALPTSTA